MSASATSNPSRAGGAHRIRCRPRNRGIGDPDGDEQLQGEHVRERGLVIDQSVPPSELEEIAGLWS